MSFLNRFKSSRRESSEDSRSSPTASRSPIAVAVPPRATVSPTPRSTAVVTGQSLFEGMNFGEGASATSEPVEEQQTTSTSETSGFSFMAKDGGDSVADKCDETKADTNTQSTSGFNFIQTTTSTPSTDTSSAKDAPEAEASSAFSFLSQAPDSSAADHSTSDAPSAFGFMSRGTEPAATTAEAPPPTVVASGDPLPAEEAGASTGRAGIVTPSSTSSSATVAADQASQELPRRISSAALTPKKLAEAPAAGGGGSPTLTPASASAKKKKKTRAMRPGHARQETTDGTPEPAKRSPQLTKSSAGSREDGQTPADGAPQVGAVQSVSSADGASGAEAGNTPPATSVPDEQSSVNTDAADTSAANSSTVCEGLDTPVVLPVSGECDGSPAAAEQAADPAAEEVLPSEQLVDVADVKEEPAIADGGKDQPEAASGVGVSDTQPVTASSDGGVSAAVNVESQQKAVGDAFSVYDIQLNVEEQLDLRRQSESSQLRDVQTNLQAAESAILAVFVSQLANQQQRLRKRCTASQLREREAEAIAQENYEEAELHSAELKAVEDSLAKGLVTTPTLDQASNWNEKRNALVQSQCTIKRESLVIVNSLLEELHKEAESHRKDTTVQLTKQRQELSEQREALVRQQSHLEVDWGLFRRSEDKLQQEEVEKTSTFREQRQELSGSLEEVQNEIRELEERLRKLRERSQALEDDIQKEDDKIEEVQRDMVEQRSRLAEQRQTLQLQQDQLDSQKALVKESEEAVEKTLQELNDRKKRLQDVEGEMQSVVRDHTSALDSSSSDLDSVRAFLFDQQRPQVTSNQSVSSLKETLVEKQVGVDDVTRKLVLSQKEVVALRKKLADIDNQLPDLESAKKVAVAGREFKEAHRLKLEREQLVAEQGTLTALLEEERQKSSGYTQLQKELQTQLDVLRTEYLHAEEECDTDAVSKFTAYGEELKALLSSADAKPTFLASLIKTDLLFCQTLCAELSMKHGKTADVSDLLEAAVSVNCAVPPSSNNDDMAQADSGQVELSSSKEDMRKSLEGQISQLEEALENAVAEEDYGKADDINTELSVLRVELSGVTSM